ncbi:ATP-binding cassette domain-containing protein [Candidatus Bipolaricaulota bacterium]|nr:ATP-binding cassette domain-containing protein [Candidatus Bipolaricaulota bacterium]MBS3792783.1 ATP-binding cassette domain-containing protein [Candidatus Bipolaricaulota bacterium]MBS3813884.1 ATP-binding cassette domain-containing protein [Candidatus Bipolaricaulota bacterium]
MNAVLEAENLKKYYTVSQSFFSRMLGSQTKQVKAVDEVNFQIPRKNAMAVVGESGCGKTTLGKVVMRLLDATDGKLIMEGKDVTELSGSGELKAYRRTTQMIFQDPFSSMDPRFTAFNTLEEPMDIHGTGGSYEERRKIIMNALEEVQLTPAEEFIDRYPHMLSGGQKQRVAIARALILNPDFIVADEPTSMLDVSVRAELLNLMKDLMEEENLTYLYITHDISTSRFFSDSISVMYLGKFVEKGEVATVLDDPLHPYSQALLKAVPEPKPEMVEVIKELPITGEVPDATNVPPGCRFHPRCPYAQDVCKKEEPELREVEGREVACHFAGEVP